MRKKNKGQFNQSGFTVIELLVVFLILVALASAGLISWNTQRPDRNMTIAQNELVTNVRKAQSYAVSSRNTSAGVGVKFYVVRFQTGSNQYTINTIDSNFNYDTIETLKLPSGLAFQEITLTPSLEQKGVQPTCISLIFSNPFGKTYFDYTGSCDSNVVNIVKNLPVLAATTDQILNLKFIHTAQSKVKGINIYGLSGKVEPE